MDDAEAAVTATEAVAAFFVDVLVVAVVLSITFGLMSGKEQSGGALVVFLGEEGNGEFGGTEDDGSRMVSWVSDLIFVLSVLVLSLDCTVLAPILPAAEVLERGEAVIVMRCILCTITIACISV